MRELWFWRGLAALAVAGWASAATGWSATVPAARETVRSEEVRAPRTRARSPSTPSARPAVDEPAVAAEVPPEAMEAARAELRTALRARHEEMAAERLAHALDGIATFAEEHGLDARTQAALEDAFVAMHDRMTSFPPPPDPLAEPPAPEEREALRARMRASFDQLHTEVLTALGGDEALAEELHETLRPPGPPGPGVGPPGFGPR